MLIVIPLNITWNFLTNISQAETVKLKTQTMKIVILQIVPNSQEFASV